MFEVQDDREMHLTPWPDVQSKGADIQFCMEGLYNV